MLAKLSEEGLSAGTLLKVKTGGVAELRCDSSRLPLSVGAVSCSLEPEVR